MLRICLRDSGGRLEWVGFMFVEFLGFDLDRWICLCRSCGYGYVS